MSRHRLFHRLSAGGPCTSCAPLQQAEIVSKHISKLRNLRDRTKLKISFNLVLQCVSPCSYVPFIGLSFIQYFRPPACQLHLPSVCHQEWEEIREFIHIPPHLVSQKHGGVWLASLTFELNSPALRLMFITVAAVSTGLGTLDNQHSAPEWFNFLSPSSCLVF